SKDGKLTVGPTLDEKNLVQPTGPVGDLNSIVNGTPFMTQTQNKLSAYLDWKLNKVGDSPEVTKGMGEVLQTSFSPVVGTGMTFSVIVLDPVSFNLADPKGNATGYDLKKGSAPAEVSRTFVKVDGNVELVVIAAPSAGQYTLNVSDVPSTARGVAVIVGPE